MLYPTELQARPIKLIRYAFRGALFCSLRSDPDNAQCLLCLDLKRRKLQAESDYKPDQRHDSRRRLMH